MPTPDKKPVPQPEPKNQPPGKGGVDVDVDDAQIEEPKDDAFEKKAPGEDNTANRLKERDKLSKNLPRE